MKRFLPFPVSFRRSVQGTFCCCFQCLHSLNRRFRVCLLHRHHPHAAVFVFFVHSRYWPVRQCPALSWWNRSASLFGPRATAAFCLSLSGILYFSLLILFSDQFHASTHFFSATLRQILAMDLGSGIRLIPYRSV